MKTQVRAIQPNTAAGDFSLVINRLKTKQCFIAKKNFEKYKACGQQLNKARTLNELCLVLNTLLDKDLYPDTVIINILIRKLAQLKQIAHADAVYAISITNNLANVVTHNSMIDATGKNGRIDLALKAYHQATDPKHDVANVVTHSSMIDAAGRNGRLDLALQAYQKATDPKHYVADVVTHNGMIDVLFMNNQINQAKAIYDNHAKQPLIRKADGIYEIDLHGLNYGVTHIALSEFIDMTPKPLNIRIIYGKGLHSKTDAEIHPIKSATQDVIKNCLQNYDVVLQEETHNFGAAHLSVTTKAALKSTSDPDTLSADKDNLAVPTPEKPNTFLSSSMLKPSSQEFIPRGNNSFLLFSPVQNTQTPQATSPKLSSGMSRAKP